MNLQRRVQSQVRLALATLVLFAEFWPASDRAQGASWSTEAPMPTARYGPGADVIDGLLYVASGATVSNFPPFPRFTNLESYDPVSNTWAEKSPIPIGVSSPTAAAIDGKLYVAGGAASQSQGNNISTLQVYDPSSDTWTTNFAPMPVACAGACGGVIDGILYVAGGMNPANTAGVSNLWAYDPNADEWSELAPLPSIRAYAGAAVIDGILYVVGGYGADGLTNMVEAYDPVTDTWTAMAPMPTTRAYIAVGVVNGILYAVGGITETETVNVVESYDPSSDTWSTAAPMPTARFGAIASSIDEVLYVVGGNSANSGAPASDNQAVNEAFTSLTTPVITWANPASIIYGLALTPSQLNASANVAGSFVYDPDIGSALDTGTNILSVVFTPNDTNDYSSVTDTVSLVVLPAPLTVTAGNTNRPYGGTNPPFSGTIGLLQNGDNISATFTCTATSSSPVGTYAIVPSLVDPDDRETNYTVSLTDGNLVITAAQLTVKADDASRLFGLANPALTGVVTGVTNSDNISANYTTGATTNSPPGTYPIVPSVVSPDNRITNYVVNLIDGTLTVIGVPVLQTVQQSGGLLSFSWSATSNQTYQIQATASLTSPDWASLGNAMVATNSIMSVSEIIGTNQQEFYRVVLLLP